MHGKPLLRRGRVAFKVFQKHIEASGYSPQGSPSLLRELESQVLQLGLLRQTQHQLFHHHPVIGPRIAQRFVGAENLFDRAAELFTRKSAHGLVYLLGAIAPDSNALP